MDSQEGSISHGFNFRTALYDFDTSTTTRTLRKLHGIRLIFLVNGSGGKFNFGALTITFGAGLAYLGIASILTDIVLSNCLKESKAYNERKVEQVFKSVVQQEIEKKKDEEFQKTKQKWVDEPSYEKDEDELEDIHTNKDGNKNDTESVELHIKNNKQENLTEINDE